MYMWAATMLVISLTLITGLFLLVHIEGKRGERFFAPLRHKLDTKAYAFTELLYSLIAKTSSFNLYSRARFAFFYILSIILRITAKISAKITKLLHVGARRLEYTTTKPSDHLKEIKRTKEKVRDNENA